MALNFPSSPTLNQTYDYGSATYVYDGSRWKPLSTQYSYSGETKSSNTATVTLDLSNGNLFDIEPIEDILEIEFINPPDAVQSFTVKVGADDFYYSSWNLLSASYDNVSFLVSGQDTNPYGVTFKPDGTKMYIMGNTTDRVYQYTLATPWNVGTAAYDSVSFSVAGQESFPYGVTFKPDGTKMYIMGFTNGRVYQYTLATPWNVGTAAYDSVSFLVSGQDTNPYGVAFKPDGTKMYIMGNTTDRVYQYTLATPWNVGTAAYDNVSFLVSGQDTGPVSVTFKPDGTKMYIMGNTTDRVYQYSLSDTISSTLWPSNVIWNNNTTPTIYNGQNLLIEFYTSDGGSSIYGVERYNREKTA